MESMPQQSIFRLETLSMYQVPKDFIIFKTWKKDKSIVNKAFRDWFHLLEKTKKRQVTMQRVRIITLPLSEYLKYEVDVWKQSAKKGEQIFFLESKLYQELIKQLQLKPKDFWLFDNNRVILFHYNKKGNFLKEELVQNKKTIKQYENFKEILLERSLPLKKFVKKKLTESKQKLF